MDFTVILVGAGNMGGAMLRGWLASGLAAENACVVDPKPSNEMAEFLSQHGVRHCETSDGLKPADVLVVAVKPQMMGTVLPAISNLANEETVVVSVAAGTTIASIADAFPLSAVIRVMPNTPSLIGRGMSVGCANERATKVQRSRVTMLMQSVGRMEWVDEEALIDAVTAVSGSGPAYVFHLAECMAQAGEKIGLSKELAMILARETVAGAGELLRQSDDTPQKLRENVTSTGGTTAAALNVLMKDGGMSELFADAILAAKQRSEELS